MTKQRSSKFTCKGCEITDYGPFFTDEVVHSEGCIFYEQPAPSFEERVRQVVLADIKRAAQ